MKRKTLIWIIILLAAVAGGFAFYAFIAQTTEQEQASLNSDSTNQTTVARRGDLIVFASGTGQLVSLDETTLQFDENGTLVELLVNVGDQVWTGDVLARLQVDKSETQLTADIAKVQLTVIEAQQALDALYAEAEITAAQALYNLEEAQNELDSLQNNDLEVAQAMQAVAQAGEEIEDAKMALYIYNSAPSEDDIYTAYASLLFKEKEYNERKAEVADLEYEHKTAETKMIRERIADQLDRAKAQMYNAQITYEEALHHYETMDDPTSPLDLNLAQARMDTAQAQLDQANLALSEAQLGASDSDIALAKAKVTEAQAEWARWVDGPDPQEVLLAETRLKTSQLELQLAEQESLTVDLTSPMNGTVMEINAAVNEFVDSTSIITLADISQPLIEISLDETDLQSVQVGNRVEVTFDAFPDNVFLGSIVEISPSMERTFGSQAIKALAVLDEGFFAKPFSLPLGLNASVDVIAGEANNAVLVPIEALHQTSPGIYTIYVQAGDGFEPRQVTVGLMDFTSAEITSGLEAGEIVAIGNIYIE